MRVDGGRKGPLILLAALAMTLGGCAASPGADVAPTPSVYELARLQRSGLLDQERLECVVATAAPLARDIQESSRFVRDLRRSQGVPSGHAQSVQQGMANSDQADVAARAALNARRTVQQAAARGDYTMAALYASYAAEALGPARDPGALGQELWYASYRGSELTDDEAALLVEYAELRGQLVSGGSAAAPNERVLEIESTAPSVIEVYASFLLDLYGNEEVVCSEGAY